MAAHQRRFSHAGQPTRAAHHCHQGGNDSLATHCDSIDMAYRMSSSSYVGRWGASDLRHSGSLAREGRRLGGPPDPGGGRPASIGSPPVHRPPCTQRPHFEAAARRRIRRGPLLSSNTRRSSASRIEFSTHPCHLFPADCAEFAESSSPTALPGHARQPPLVPASPPAAPSILALSGPPSCRPCHALPNHSILNLEISDREVKEAMKGRTCTWWGPLLFGTCGATALTTRQT
jgi:hypothetical protein